MAKFVLKCYCGSKDFRIEGLAFYCTQCDQRITEDAAGFQLMEEDK